VENIVVWTAIAFVVGTVFGMTVTANALRGNGPQSPTVVVMEQRRLEMIGESRGGCVAYLVLAMIVIVAALVILGS
jgi:hypothetical protein